jgi:hypothetical protein
MVTHRKSWEPALDKSDPSTFWPNDRVTLITNMQ